jgi:hypothetical protein
MDPRIRIQIHPKMSWIRNTAANNGGFRRTGARSRSAFSSRTLDSSSLASNIQKLFSERIDFFTPVRSKSHIKYVIFVGTGKSQFEKRREM